MPKVHGNEYSYPPRHQGIARVDINEVPSLSVVISAMPSLSVDISTMPTLSVDIASMPTLSVLVSQIPTLASPVAISVTQDVRSAANILAVAGVAAQRHYITGFEAIVFDGVASVADLLDLPITILNGSTTVYKTLIAHLASRGDNKGATFTVPIQCGVAATISIQASAAGPSTGTTLNLTYFTL